MMLKISITYRFLFWQTLIWITFLIPVFSQTNFTLPKNVWRVSIKPRSFSGNWISEGGKVGLPNEYFTLYGYGRRYYDHEIPDTYNDLVGLGDILLSASSFDQVQKLIRLFNGSSVAESWGDSLYDFTEDFFGEGASPPMGPDTVHIFGYITNPRRNRIENGMDITIEYGLSDRYTFVFELPYYLKINHVNKWGWKDNTSDNEMLENFVRYHLENKAKFENLFESDSFDSLSVYLASRLRTIYNQFYTVNGKYSVLWALNAGTDPFKNGIYGSEFNPFSNQDTVATTIDSILAFYHPDQVGSGLGDISWRINFLLFGSPSWVGESIVSIYGGIGMKIPTGRLIDIFNENKIDKYGRPKQFSQLYMGDGVTQWQFSLFGEFYRKIYKRLIRFNWKVQYQFSIEDKFPTRVSPRGMYTVDNEEILEKLGDQYRFKKGDIFTTDIVGFLELIPDRISITAGLQWFFKQRDRYYSKNNTWNEWMAGGTDLHSGYDTRVYQLTQRASIIFHNSHPLKKYGPVPFELEIKGESPIIVRHSWKGLSLSMILSLYLQFW